MLQSKLKKKPTNGKVHPYLNPVTNDPHLTARQDRRDKQLALLAAGKLWRNAATLALMSNLVLATAVVAMFYMRKETPFVLAVDKWGYTVPVGTAESVNLETYIQYHLKRFVRLSRSISIDSFALEKNIKDAYTFVKRPSSAFNYLNEYYVNEQKPFERAKELSNFVDDVSIIRVSENTFRARWSETTRALSGHMISQDRYWGEFTYKLHTSERQDPADRDSNPLSLKIEQITWAKE